MVVRIRATYSRVIDGEMIVDAAITEGIAVSLLAHGSKEEQMEAIDELSDEIVATHLQV